MTEPAVLSVRDLARHYRLAIPSAPWRRATVRAVDGVAFDLYRGQTLCIVGGSGSGKSTVARLLMRLERPTSGEVLLDGVDIAVLSGRGLRDLRRRMQIVFQDPFGSLNPRRTVAQIIAEPWEIHRGLVAPSARRERAAELMAEVGLDTAMLDRYPHAFSGGQRQRISIARALAVDPEILICDEALSALDVSVQAQVANLLLSLQRRRQLSYVFISHDLAVVWQLADHVLVMNRGRIVEEGPPERLFDNPQDEYTRVLIESIPRVPPLSHGGSLDERKEDTL